MTTRHMQRASRRGGTHRSLEARDRRRGKVEHEFRVPEHFESDLAQRQRIGRGGHHELAPAGDEHHLTKNQCVEKDG